MAQIHARTCIIEMEYPGQKAELLELQPTELLCGRIAAEVDPSGVGRGAVISVKAGAIVRGRTIACGTGIVTAAEGDRNIPRQNQPRRDRQPGEHHH